MKNKINWRDRLHTSRWYVPQNGSEAWEMNKAYMEGELVRRLSNDARSAYEYRLPREEE
jgi:hypothetical protein